MATISKININDIIYDIEDSAARSQSDWNESNETSLSYIQNKPFGKVQSRAVAIEKNGATPNNPIYFAETDPSNGLVKAGTYIVTVNGTEYTINKSTDGATNGYLLGDSSWSVMPVLFQYQGPTSGYCLLRSSNSSTTYNIKVEYASETIKYLDDEYISNNIARVSDVDEKFELTHDWNNITENRPFYYTETTLSTVYSQATLSNGASGGSFGFGNMAAGTFRVTIDGTDKYIVNKSVGFPDIGDANFTQYPFFIDPPNIYFKDGGSHTYKVEEISIDLKTLDEKFIPDTIARTSDLLTIKDIMESDELVQVSYNTETDLTKIATTFNKIKNSIKEGKLVLLHYSNEPFNIDSFCIMELYDEDLCCGNIINGEGVYSINFTANSVIGAYVTKFQEKLIGTKGQIVGFDENGNAVAQDANVQYATDEDILEFVMDAGYVNPVISDSNLVYTNKNGDVYIL